MAARSTPLLLVGAVLVGGLIAAALWLLDDGADRGAELDALRAQPEPVEVAPTNPEPPPRVTPATESAQPARLDAREPEPAAVESAPRAPLAGTLRRLADGAPLAGWTVTPPRATEPTPLAARTDDDGRFEFESVRRDLTQLRLTRVGFPKGHSVSFDLPDDAFEREGEWTVDTGWVLEGRVRSATARPLDGAGVLGDGRAWTTPEPDGSFRLEDVGPRGLVPGPYALELGAALHERVRLTLDLVDEQRVVTGLDVELAAAGALEGRVLGADGYAHPFELVSLPLRLADDTLRRTDPMPTSAGLRPVSTLRGWSREPGGDVPSSSVAATDALRHYRVDSIPPGRYVVRVEVPGDPMDEVRRVMERALAETVAENGRAAAASAPDVSMVGVTPDGPPSHAAADHWERQVDIVAGEVTRLDVRLAWGAALDLRVTDALGASLPGAEVEVVRRMSWDFARNGTYLIPPEDGFELRQLAAEDHPGSVARLEIVDGRATTDVNGRALLGRLPPGELLVRVRAPTAASLRAYEAVQRFVAGEVTRLDVNLDRGFSIRGRLLDEQGLPVVDARVAAKRPSNAVIITAEDLVPTDEHGAFEIGGLDAGEWVLHLSAPGFVDATHAAEAGGPPLELVLTRARGLALRLLDAADDTPLPECTLTLHAGNTYTQRSAPTDDGRVFLDGLGADPVTLTVGAPGYTSLTREGLTPHPAPREQMPELVLRLSRDS